MSADLVAVLVQHVRAMAGELPGTEESDRELLRRFTAQHDDSAFETLIRRHGPMVLRLSRRLLANSADVDDVFQATFLVLASRASGVRWRDSITNWLFGVTHRLARKANLAAARRTALEARVPSRSVADPLAEISGRELLCILDEELLRLPDKLREPLLLCYLEGLTRDEAAQRIGCPLGTLKSRLERGKELLGQALTKRGVSLSAALTATLALAERGSATVTPAVLQGTLAQLRSAGTVRPAVRALVETSAPLSLAKATVAFGLLLVGLLTAGLAAQQQPQDDPPPPTSTLPASPPKPTRRAVDGLGDPLPAGALMRLGTRRHRVQNWPFNWVSRPDGQSYLIHQHLGLDNEIRRLDSATGRILERWPIPRHQNAVGLSPDGRHALLMTEFLQFSGLRLPAADEMKQEWALTLYDLVKRKEMWTRREMLTYKDWKRIASTRFSPDGKWIATAGRFNGDLRVWDATTGKELWHHPNTLNLEPLGFTDEGNSLVVRAWTGNTILVFDRATGKKKRSFSTFPENEAQQCLLSPDGTAVLFGRYGPTILIWDVATGKERAPFEGHTKWARQMAFTRDGKTLVTGGNDPFVLVRDWPSGKIRHKIEVRPKAIDELAISGDGRRLEVLFWGEQALHFYDLATGKPLPAPLDSHRGTVHGLAFAPDGKLLTYGRDSSVRTWDLKTQKAVGFLPVDQDLNAGGFAVCREGRLLAVSNSDNKAISIYDRTTGKLVRKLPLEQREAKSLAFSPDGRWLAGSEGTAGILRVWEIATGKVVLKLDDRVTYGFACAFNPDGRQFAATGEGQVRFWEVGTWKEQASLRAYAPLGLAYSPDGRLLATGAVDGVRLFELATCGERAHIRPTGYPWGSLMRFSPSGRFLVWQTDPRSALIWDIHRGNLLGPFVGHDDSVTGLAFTADERALATSSDDSTILLWDVAGPAAKKSTLNVGDVDQAWNALTDANAKVAHEVIGTLAASPKAAIERITQHIKPVAAADADRIAACLRDLDSAKFEVRSRASRDLEQMGEAVVAALERALENKPSLEVRRRIEAVLDRFSDRLRQIRALEVLERIGDEQAKGVLKQLATGTPDARLTRDAQSALKRMMPSQEK